MLSQFWHICPALLVLVPCPFDVFAWSKSHQVAHPTPNLLFPLCSSCYAFRSRHPSRAQYDAHAFGAKSLRDPLVSQVLDEWVASSPLAKARWYEATKVARSPVIRSKQIEAVKQYASVLFPAPELMALLMDLNVPKGGFRHASDYMTRRGATYTAATGLPFPRSSPSRDRFMDTWKK